MATTREKIRKIVRKGKFQTVTEISADGVNRYAAELKSKGRAPRTIQAYLTAIMGFTHWWATNGKLPSDPLVTVTKPNPETDRRLERRMLQHKEWQWLRDVTAAGEDRFGMSGSERVLLFETAIQTGLRSNELRSLTRGRLYLTDEKPYIICKAGSTKNRKKARQYILPDLANRLRVHIATKAPKAPMFSLPADYEMAEMLRADLDDARKSWLNDARHDEESRGRIAVLSCPEAHLRSVACDGGSTPEVDPVRDETQQHHAHDGPLPPSHPRSRGRNGSAVRQSEGQ